MTDSGLPSDLPPTMPSADVSNGDVASEKFPEVSGKLVVIVLFALGVFAAGFLWVFTYLNNRPYLALRHALFAEFGRDSSPRVDGGRERGRGPMLLRIVMHVDFDPTSKNPGTIDKINQLERRVQDLARTHHDLSIYDRWEFILVNYVPEKLPLRKEIRREISEVRKPNSPQPGEETKHQQPSKHTP